MTYTIIGGGFGLYGYLPAMAVRGYRVLLPTKYQASVAAREDLKQFKPIIDWVSSTEEGLRNACAVVIATPPAVQQRLVKKIISDFPNIEAFHLEKPIAATPTTAANLLDLLEFNSKRVKVGFIFPYCSWTKQLATAAESSKSININWQFKAQHFCNELKTWKRLHKHGGGPIRFYGIHLIALLANLGYSSVSQSQVIAWNSKHLTVWSALFEGEGVAPCAIQVDTLNDSKSFSLNTNSEMIISMQDPFDGITLIQPKVDRRAKLIADVIDSEWSSNFRFLRRITSLWSSAETDLGQILGTF